MNTTSARPDRLHHFASLTPAFADDIRRATASATAAAEAHLAADPTNRRPTAPANASWIAQGIDELAGWVRQVAWAFASADEGSLHTIARTDEATLATELARHDPGAVLGGLRDALTERLELGRLVGETVAATPRSRQAQVLREELDRLSPHERSDPALAAAVLSEFDATALVSLVTSAARRSGRGTGRADTPEMVTLAGLLATASRTWDQTSPLALDRGLVEDLLASPAGRDALRDLVMIGAATVGVGRAFLTTVARGALVNHNSDEDERAWLQGGGSRVGRATDGDEQLLAALAANPLSLVDLLGTDGRDAEEVGYALTATAQTTEAQAELAAAIRAALALPQMTPKRASTARAGLLAGIAAAAAERPARIGAKLAEVMADSVIEDPAAWRAAAGTPTSTADEATAADDALAAVAAHQEVLARLLTELDVRERMLLGAALRPSGAGADLAQIALADHRALVAALERGAAAADVPSGTWVEVLEVTGLVAVPATKLLPGGALVQGLARPAVEQLQREATEGLPRGSAADDVRARRLASTRNLWLAIAADPDLAPLVNWAVAGSPLRNRSDLAALGGWQLSESTLEAWVAAQPATLRVLAADLER